MKINKKIIFIIFVIFALSGGLFFKVLLKSRSINIKHSVSPLIGSGSVEIVVGSDDQIYGNPGAPITIVEFVDFSCVLCYKNYFIIKKTIDQNPQKIRLMLKDAPLGGIVFKGDTLPHRAAYCAGKQKKYWQFVDLLGQSKKMDISSLEKIASGLNLNIEEWKNCNDSSTAAEKIDEDIILAKNLGIKSVPEIFINNQKINLEDNYDLEKILLMFIKKL